MAHGHPDYWSYSSAQLPVPGIEQIPLILDGTVVIAGGAAGVVYNITPAAGEDIFIAGGLVTTDGPGIHRYFFSLGPTVYQDIYFDTEGRLPVNPSALLRIPSGVLFIVGARNDDTIAHTFNITGYGFRAVLVPGAVPPIGLGLTIAGAGV